MKRTFFFIATAVALLSSCNKDDKSVNSEMSEEETPSVVTIMPATATLETKAAIDGTTFPTDRTFLLSAYYNAESLGTSTNYFSGITFSKHATESYWCAASPKYWPFSGTLDLLAVSYDGLTPTSTTYDTKVSDGVTLILPDNSSIQTDILHGSLQTQAKSSTSVGMSFNHAEALVCFVAKSDVPYDATNNLGITIEEITVNNAYFSGTVAIKAAEDPTNGYCTWTALGTQKTTLNLLKAGATPSATLSYDVPVDYMDYDATGNHMGIGGVGIIVPEQTQTAVTVKYTMHNGKNASSGNLDNTGLYHTFTLSGTWVEGKKHIYKLYFKPQEITITPTVVDWDNTPVEKTI